MLLPIDTKIRGNHSRKSSSFQTEIAGRYDAGKSKITLRSVQSFFTYFSNRVFLAMSRNVQIQLRDSLQDTEKTAELMPLVQVPSNSRNRREFGHSP